MRDFHLFAEILLGRPIFTHEFANEDLWAELRERFEAETIASADGWKVGSRS
jgi:hypothetical protein